MFLVSGLIGAVITAFISSLSRGNVVMIILSSIMSFFVVGYFGWVNLPTLSLWGFMGAWFLLWLALGFAVIGSLGEKTNLTARWAFGLATGFILVVPFLASNSFFHAPAYHRLLGEPKVSRFSETVSPVDITHMRIVPYQTARQIANRLLGQDPGLGSRVSVGELQTQSIEGTCTVREHGGTVKVLDLKHKLFMVAPLEHNGFFRWWTNGVTPGYVMVSATDPNEKYLVTAIKSSTTQSDNTRMGQDTSVGGEGFENLKLRYLNAESYFGDYVMRHLYTNGYATRGITDPTFEIDDNCHPYWTITLYEPKIGFSGSDATGVVTVDAQTGEIREYTIANAPKWIDRIQPQSFVTSQLDWWGQFKNGWWNKYFVGQDVIETTPGIQTVYGADGVAYYYTGMQSAGKEESSVGAVLVNTRTKEVKLFEIGGASENAAAASAANAKGVRESRFHSTFPVLYNIGSVPTYFVPLVGDDDLVKMVAFVSLENHNIVGVGRTPEEALRDYQVALSNSGAKLAVDDIVQNTTLEGVVADIAQEQLQGTTFYYVRMEGQAGLEFFGTSTTSPELKWTKPGNRVKVSFSQGAGTVRSLQLGNFDNLDLQMQ